MHQHIVASFQSMILSHYTPADANYAELLDIVETLTFTHQSCYLICRNRRLLICSTFNFVDYSLTHADLSIYATA